MATAACPKDTPPPNPKEGGELLSPLVNYRTLVLEADGALPVFPKVGPFTPAPPSFVPWPVQISRG